MAKPMVGLTGGIASGKSTVAGFFRARGVPVVDADEVARAVVEPGTPGLAEIVDAFGTDILDEAGGLDRQKLGAIVFADARARARLNALIHPRIAAESARRMSELAEGDAPYLIYEAALLVENGIHRGFDALVVAAVDLSTQIDRIMKRDGLDWRDAEARVDAQLPLEDKVAAADFVITTDGPYAQTEQQVEEVHRALLERLATKRG